MERPMGEEMAPNNKALWFWPQHVEALPTNSQTEVILYRSCGVPATRHGPHAKHYASEAYIPSDRWERQSTPNPLPAPAIPRCGVFRLPSYNKDAWIKLSLFEFVDPPRYWDATKNLTREITSELCDLFGALEEPVIQGLCSDEGNEPTVAFDTNQNNLPGLHLDSWEGGSFEERSGSRTRLCVNLGPGDRFYLFVPLTLQTVARCLPAEIQDKAGKDATYMATYMIMQFFETFPDAPIMRLTVRPGCGYFADTDNMIHDGSTMGEPLDNTHFTIRGYFRTLHCAS
jgi:hypothetical protein